MKIGLHQQKKQHHQALRKKALEPHERYCRILKKKVNILIEYFDYKSPTHKGEEGTIYCENILDCYQNEVKCKYSGISPLYPDPFWGTAEAPEAWEEEISKESPAAQPGEDGPDNS
jgi:hypothetical protein